MCMTKNEVAAYLLATGDSNTKISGKRFTIAVSHEFFFLGGQNVRGDRDTKDVLDWLKGLATTFCDERLQKLVPRCDRCRNLLVYYVEK